GEVGTRSPRYAATGETVGFANRMESVAPPGGVMLSEATARLVGTLDVHPLGFGQPHPVLDQPVRVHRLVSIDPRHDLMRRTEASLVGRRWETAAIDAALER
ncbi:hypothetical protein C6A85_70545, partial [Mycobacterium sp. ITM-2017-0098]